MKRLLRKASTRHHRHDRLPPVTARCAIRYLNGNVDEARQSRLQSCFGSQYLYFEWRSPPPWGVVQAVHFHLDEDQVITFPIRQLCYTRGYTVIEGERYDEWRFDHEGCSLMYRHRPGQPSWVVLRHTPH